MAAAQRTLGSVPELESPQVAPQSNEAKRFRAFDVNAKGKPRLVRPGQCRNYRKNFRHSLMSQTSDAAAVINAHTTMISSMVSSLVNTMSRLEVIPFAIAQRSGVPKGPLGVRSFPDR